MGKPLIMVTSITYAMKGKEILKKNGFAAELVRTPRGEKINGCGYSIYVSKNTDKAEEILIKAGIKVLGRANREDIK